MWRATKKKPQHDAFLFCGPGSAAGLPAAACRPCERTSADRAILAATRPASSVHYILHGALARTWPVGYILPRHHHRLRGARSGDRRLRFMGTLQRPRLAPPYLRAMFRPGEEPLPITAAVRALRECGRGVISQVGQ